MTLFDDIDPISSAVDAMIGELISYAFNADSSLPPVTLSADSLMQIESIIQDELEKEQYGAPQMLDSFWAKLSWC